MTELPIVSDPPIISFHDMENANQIIFSLKMVDGKLVGSTTDPEKIDEAVRIFFNNLQIHGQNLFDQVNTIKSIVESEPNDMILGNKIRKYINENSVNSSR